MPIALTPLKGATVARFDTSGLDELIRDMENMGQMSGPVAEVMVEAAAAEIRESWREAAESHGLRDTGAMIESIDAPGPVVDFGTSLGKDIYPTGKDSKGVRNDEKAFILHYGRNGYQKIEATYWVDDADDISAVRVPPRLDAIWEEFLQTGKVPALPASATSAGGITKKVQ